MTVQRRAARVHRFKALFFGLALGGVGPQSSLAEGTKGAVATLLYGAADADTIMAPGLHGFGATPSPVILSELGPCRFRVSSSNRSEDIDFSRVAEIRVALIDDPASGLVAAVARRSGTKHEIGKLVVVQIIGEEGAVCSTDGCVDRRAFSFKEIDKLEAARQAAVRIQDHLCPGLRLEQPRSRGNAP